MIKKYTIRDIAEMAGVSKGTVDRVIHKRGKVSETAAKKVTTILKEIDFKPNLIARNLKTNKTYHICVLLPDPIKDPYWIPCVKGVNEVVLELSHFGIKIETSFFDPTKSKSFTAANLVIQNNAPDAVLLAPLFFKEARIVMQDYENLGIIVSTFNNDIESKAVKSFIGQDLFQSGRVAAKLLHSVSKTGDLAIVHINEQYENAVFMQEKERGFKSFFNELVSFNYSVLQCKLNQEDFELVLTAFLKDHPNLTSIFVTTSKTYLVADFLEKNNHKTISLVGYDLLNENVTHLKTGSIDFLIHQNPKEQTYIGLKFLAEHLLFEKEIPKELLLPIDIVNSENATPFMRR
ncbi:substrate-binding domain-containing protein [Algibacter pacificus]|uniref:substrate-binding domain-containing protein n=1 Tax=Algibacter pacificus TaxID=2599389 RepID=UPI0011CC7D5D|nr:LacI family DNA-binding transcriptional regulator [Algibacter pacificus]